MGSTFALVYTLAGENSRQGHGWLNVWGRKRNTNRNGISKNHIIAKSQVDFSVYPNPNDGNFILYLKNNTETKQPYLLEIYNSLGIPILKINGVLSEMESKQITERIVLSQGVYYAILRSTGSNCSLKIVITP